MARKTAYKKEHEKIQRKVERAEKRFRDAKNLLARIERKEADRQMRRNGSIRILPIGGPKPGKYYRMRNGEVCGPIEAYNPILVTAPLTREATNFPNHPPHHTFDMSGRSTWDDQFDLIHRSRRPQPVIHGEEWTTAKQPRRA